MKFIRWCINNPITVNLMVIFLVLAGWVSLQSMSRELFPEFTLDRVLVTVVFPGATPEQIEEGVCVKIEQAISGLAGVKEVTSSARDSAGTVVVEIETGEDIDEIKDEVETRVNAITTFPTDAEKPVIKKLELVKEVLKLVVSGKMSESSLRQLCEEIKDDLIALPDVSQVSVAGLKDFEISIELRDDKLRELNMTFDEVSQAIQANSIDLSGGFVKTSERNILLRIKEQKYTKKDYENIIIRSSPKGGMIRLKDISDIKDAFADTPLEANLDGVRAGLVGVYKTENEDIITISNQVKEYLEEKKKTLPKEVRLYINSDTSVSVNSRLTLLTKNGMQGLFLVFMCLWLFLNLHLSFWTSIGIPISMLGTFILLDFSGQSLNMLSMFGLIMALGIIVDDAVVISESIHARRTSDIKESMAESALHGTAEVFWPIIASVSTTVVAFLPLMFMSGIMGKFIAILPITVISCLVVSLVEALIALPVHLAHYLPDEKLDENHDKSFRAKLDKGFDYFVNLYSKFLRKAVNYRYITLGIAVSILIMTFGMVRAGLIPYVLFAAEDSDVITAKVTFSEGSSFETSEKAVNFLAKTLTEANDSLMKEFNLKESLVKSTYSLIGQHSGHVPTTNTNLGEVQAELVRSENRTINSNILLNRWREITQEIPGTRSLKFAPRQNGPGGNAIEIQFRGKDFDKLKGASEDLKERLRSYPGIFDVDDNFKQGLTEIRFKLKPLARTLGIHLSSLARQVRSAFFGQEVLRLQRGEFDVKVYVRFPASARKHLSTMENMLISTPSGKKVPLLDVAELTQAEGLTEINRSSELRTINVSANLDELKTNANNITTDLVTSGFLDNVCAKHGIKYAFEGHKKEDNESVAGLQKGFAFAFLGIYLILATVFSSYLQPIVIMMAIPFGVIGALIGHFIMGYTVTMMSLFGLVALSGIVVNNSLLLIDCINSRLASGKNLMDSILDAGQTRLRPIIMTTITTISGVSALMFEKSIEAQMLIPMAITLAFGLLFSTGLTLLIIPSLYAIMADFMRFFKELWTGKTYSDQKLLAPPSMLLAEKDD